jgi:glycosyltransferase involved in cell wall biosynthesis
LKNTLITPQELEKRIVDSYELPNRVLETIPEPMVTVRTSTYQHAAYIRECIEGVLMQQTTFPFEYIIGEDFSTDGTREIVFEYAKKYPDKIRVITAGYNVGMKANGRRCTRASRGKYIALCEGDDYWTDPLKLQRQVDFLEDNPEYTMCCHASFMKYENNPEKSLEVHAADSDKTFSIDYFLEPGSKNIFRTESIVFRSELAKSLPDWFCNMLVGDYPLFLILAHHGKIQYFDQVMSVYRKHDGGIWTSNSENVDFLEKYFLNTVYMYKRFDEYTGLIYHKKIQKRIAYRYVQMLKNLRKQEKTYIKAYWKYFWKLPLNLRYKLIYQIYIKKLR